MSQVLCGATPDVLQFSASMALPGELQDAQAGEVNMSADTTSSNGMKTVARLRMEKPSWHATE